MITGYGSNFGPLQGRLTPAPQAFAARAIARTALPSEQTPDPLPTFKTLDQYKNYAISLVTKAKIGQQKLTEARAALNKGVGTRTAVAGAQAELDATLLQLSMLRDQVKLPVSWTLFGHGFDKDKFWQEQDATLPASSPLPSLDTVVPTAPIVLNAPQPIALPTGAYLAPLADARRAAAVWAQAGGDSNKAQAQTAFAQAASLVATPDEAIAVATVAEQWKYHREGVAALERGLSVASNPDGALQIATAAAQNSATVTALYKDTAQKGFRRAADLANTYQAAVSVANEAAPFKYSVEGVYALNRALDLSKNWNATLAIGRVASEDVKNNLSIRYREPAHRAFMQAADQCTASNDAYQVAQMAKQYGDESASAYASDIAAKLR